MSLTQLLVKFRHGDSEILPELFSHVYQELRQIAAREKRRFFNCETINTSALVNEVYLKLVSLEKLDLENREHFFAVAAMAMRQILINYAEQKGAKKRGGDQQRVTLMTMGGSQDVDIETLLSINSALEQLQTIDAKLATLVEMRFFAGMSETEIAKVMDITTRTVRRNWSKARALLQQILENSDHSKVKPQL